MSFFEPPYYPIIYVRGYAGSQSEVEDTVADPYMGFNLGSTKLRQLWTGKVDRHYFESPLVRLMKDYDYQDVYESGQELPASFNPRSRSIFIYRYYDQVSEELGPGVRPEIEEYARGLGRLILRLRERYRVQDSAVDTQFRVYLIAHSMGGLVCRCFLQNDQLVDANESQAFSEARKAVDKVLTYATPHNGIELNLVGNVPGFFSRNNADNFNRDRMRMYLGLAGNGDNVSNLDGGIDPDRCFNLVGTNYRDYTVAAGMARTMVGPMSDGLVRIANATTWGPWPVNGQQVNKHSPRAFVHRSHSGHYGIVNSEEGYQNLARFLFGNIRVDGHLEIKQLTLPPDVDKAFKQQKKIRASYHFEAVVRTRGARFDLHRRTVDEGSAVFRTFDELLLPQKLGLTGPRHPYLFSTFLSAQHRIKQRRGSLGFSIDLGVLVPQYEVDGLLWFDHHYDGGYLYRDKINLEALPPQDTQSTWRIRVGYDSRTPNRATTTIDPRNTAAGLEFRIPIQQHTKPGIDAELVLCARPWNA
ncbi:hypothetical protein HED60_13910 [Planctomycetales bacterium ZRK34]|nr:hypothetical protein HED60_13910 [Planctomycetales bacterium ZRK34]